MYYVCEDGCTNYTTLCMRVYVCVCVRACVCACAMCVWMCWLCMSVCVFVRYALMRCPLWISSALSAFELHT